MKKTKGRVTEEAEAISTGIQSNATLDLEQLQERRKSKLLRRFHLLMIRVLLKKNK
jgi:hypothetical protein